MRCVLLKLVLLALIATPVFAQINPNQIAWPQPACSNPTAQWVPGANTCTTTTASGGLPVNNPQFTGTLTGPAANIANFTGGISVLSSINAPQSSLDQFRSHAITNCLETLFQNPASGNGWLNTTSSCLDILWNSYAPGYSLGGSGLGPGGWVVTPALTITTNVSTPGISELIAGVQNKAGVGDNTGFYFYNWNYGGATANQDEGLHLGALQGGEQGATYQGTVASGGSGATLVAVNCTIDCGHPGDGRYLIDTQTPVASGSIVSFTPPNGETPGTFTLTSTVPVSKFWGTLNAGINTPQALPIGTGSTAMTFAVTKVGGSGAPAAGDLLCFGGMFHEQAKVTSVTGTGPYTFTANLRHAHNASSWVMDGGTCGSFLDMTANDAPASTVFNNQNNQTFHYPIDILGSTSANTVVYRYFSFGTGQNWGQIGQAGIGGYFGAMLNQSWNASATNVGGLVSLHINGAPPAFASASTLYLSGSTDATFNGACTNVRRTGNDLLNNFSCTQASSTGHTTGSVNAAYGTSQYGNSAFTMWSGAEVLDVLDETQTPPVINGHLTMEPNNAAWSSGDTVEQPHHYAVHANTMNNLLSINDPIGIYNGGLDSGFQGLGISGMYGSYCYSCYHMESLQNSNPQSMYVGFGGTLYEPGGIKMTGPIAQMLTTSNAPARGFAMAYLGCQGSECTDPTYYYATISANGTAGGTTYPLDQFYPATAEHDINGSAIRLSGGVDDFNAYGQITFNPLSAAGNLGSAAFTGGTLADNTTYYYYVVATNSYGAGLRSNEIIVTTGSHGGSNGIRVQWTRVPGASGYTVCRGTSSGTEQQIFQNPGGWEGNITFLDDTGLATSGACPGTTNTSLAGISNASQVGVASADGTYQQVIKSAATLTSWRNIYLPNQDNSMALAGWATDPGGYYGDLTPLNDFWGGNYNGVRGTRIFSADGFNIQGLWGNRMFLNFNNHFNGSSQVYDNLNGSSGAAWLDFEGQGNETLSYSVAPPGSTGASLAGGSAIFTLAPSGVWIWNPSGTGFYHDVVSNATANRTLNLPDASGTVALTTTVFPTAQVAQSAQIGQIAIGGLQNWVQNAATMSGTGWATYYGVTVTPGQTDPYGGTNAVRLTASGAYIAQNPPVNLTSGATYVACGWMKGAAGGEGVQIGIGATNTTLPALTTSWQFYGPIVAAPTGNLNNILQIFNSSSETTYAYGWSVTPGTTCPGFLPTTAQVTTSIQGISTPTGMLSPPPYFNMVSQGGIDNTGATDVGAAIAAKIISYGANPPVFYFPAGTYKIDSGVQLACTSTTCQGITILGDGLNSTIFTSACTNGYAWWVNQSSITGSYFFGGQYKSFAVKDTSGTGACGSLFRITNVAKFRFDDVELDNAKGLTYTTGTVTATNGSTAVTGSGTTWTAAMAAGISILHVAGKPQFVCSVGSATTLTLCMAWQQPTATGSAYSLDYNGVGLLFDPGASYVQYGETHNVNASGNMVGIGSVPTTGGGKGTSRIWITGGYINGQRVPNSKGSAFGDYTDTVKWDAAVNNVAFGTFWENGHANRIEGNIEDNSTYTPVTTCNGGVATQSCVVGHEFTGDASGHSYGNSIDAAYVYLTGTAFMVDSSNVAPLSITNPKIMNSAGASSNLVEYNFSGTTGCPANASGIKATVIAYDCVHYQVTPGVN